MEPIKDASDLFEFERLTHHLERPGFRITELQISPTQQVVSPENLIRDDARMGVW